jgi:hypothetical protein
MTHSKPSPKSQDLPPKTYNVAINPLPLALQPLTQLDHWVVWICGVGQLQLIRVPARFADRCGLGDVR